MFVRSGIGVFPLSQHFEIYTCDWFWLGGNTEHKNGGREREKLVTVGYRMK